MEQNNGQQGACVHFKFVSSDKLDNIPAFRQWLLSNNQTDKIKTNTLSNIVIQNLKID